MTTPGRLARALGALLLLNLFGVLGYHFLCDMSWGNAAYMTAITITTVGYYEVEPLDGLGRVFTVVLLYGGLGVFFFSAMQVAQDLIEGGVRKAIGRRRVQRQISTLSDHFLVCGFGRMGRHVCRELTAKPVPFVVIEQDLKVRDDIEAESYLCIAGDATDDAVLVEAGIQRARGLVAALSSDADNVYVVLSARELNPNLLIVARADDERSERKLIHAGATRVVSPYMIGGHRMAHALLRPTVLDVLDLATHYRSMELQIEEITVQRGTFPDGLTLLESTIRESFGVIVVAIKRADGEMVFNPEGGLRTACGDRLVVIGPANNLREIERRFQEPSVSS